MEIKYNDEPDLQRKLVQKLNQKSGFHFKKTKANYFCDIVDDIAKIYIEVKPESFSPAQILYGLAQNQIESEYIGLANAFEIRLYKSPSLTKITTFAKGIDPLLKRSPSSVVKEDWHLHAYELLGEFDTIYPYPFEAIFSLTTKAKFIFIDENNYAYFKMLFDKYRINPAQFLTFITSIYAENNEIKINNNGRILELRNGKFYQNDDQSQKTLTGSGSQTEYLPILNFHDKQLFESVRIKADDIQQIIHKIDELETIGNRRSRGRFFTMDEKHGDASKITTDCVLEVIKPTFIIEPYIGSGSLVRPIILENRIHGIGNDINSGFISVLQKELQGYGWKFTSFNTITTPLEKLFTEWQIPIDSERIVIYTNPPFGTGTTNKIASKKGELDKKKSRNLVIDYGGLESKYGTGDLLIPAIGKMVEIIKKIGHGYMAFFCPLGVFCGRQRYNKLLNQILLNFKYHGGFIFSGSQFNGVNKKKPIAFTIWEYTPNINTPLLSLSFFFEGNNIHLKKLPLLKDGWKYCEGIDGTEIGTSRNDTFNNPNPKILKTKLHNAGSQLVPRNVRKQLNIEYIPDELIYGLWSLVVGFKSITDFPIYINESYVHLPDFHDPKVQQILALTILVAIIDELNKQYCENQIAFSGVHRIFRFGNQKLTKGCEYLLDTYGNTVINATTTISTMFQFMQQHPNNEWEQTWRTQLKISIEKILTEIEYWKYIPIP